MVMCIMAAEKLMKKLNGGWRNGVFIQKKLK